MSRPLTWEAKILKSGLQSCQSASHFSARFHSIWFCMQNHLAYAAHRLEEMDVKRMAAIRYSRVRGRRILVASRHPEDTHVSLPLEGVFDYAIPAKSWEQGWLASPPSRLWTRALCVSVIALPFNINGPSPDKGPRQVAPAFFPASFSLIYRSPQLKQFIWPWQLPKCRKRIQTRFAKIWTNGLHKSGQQVVAEKGHLLYYGNEFIIWIFFWYQNDTILNLSYYRTDSILSKSTW